MVAKSERLEEIDANYEAFTAMLPTLMALIPGKYALMRDRQVVFAGDGPGDALREGFKLFPDERYSIQHVTDVPICLGWYSFASGRVAPASPEDHVENR